MKAFLALFCLVAVSSAADLYGVGLLGNHLEDLVKETIEYARSLLKKHDPYTLPFMPDQHLVDTDIDVVLSASNVGVSKASDFIVDNMKVSPLTLKASFQVTVPTVHVEGNYKISGTVWKKKVEGSGTFSGDVSSFVQSGSVQLGVVDHSIQVIQLNLTYSVEAFKISMEGLNIEGMDKQQINDLLNKQLFNYFQTHKAFVAEHTAVHVKSIANRILYGHSLIEVIQWVEKLLTSTPDPLPFTFAP